MIKKLKQLILSSLAATLFLTPMAAVGVAHAAETFDPGKSVCNGVDINVSPDASSGDCSTNTTVATSQVNNTVRLGLNVFSAIVGIISVVMIIVGGIRYITSGGDSGKVSSAQNTVLYAVIGLIVVALAQVIVKFVLGKFVGAGTNG